MTEDQPELTRALGAWDVAAITAGTILGSAIFIAAAFVPREVPHPTLVLALWLAGSLVAIAGALTYAELGTMFPEAGGQYHYLKQAFGPLAGFLFGWASLLAIQSGGIAYIAVAFGDYLGSLLPFVSTHQAAFSLSLGPWHWQPTTAQLAGVAAIALLSAINYVGVREGARVQTFLTALKVASLVGLIVAGLAAPAKASLDWTAPLPRGNLAAMMGLALVAILGNYDGWYQATLSAGEIKRPERNLPLGMIGGTVVVAVIYLLVNVVYFRAMPLEAIGQSTKIGEDAATALLGPIAGRLLAGAVVLSTFSCISSSIVGGSRLCLPMAADGSFFPWFAKIHPRFKTPTTGIGVLAVWSAFLVLSGSYEQIFDYVLFASFIFHAATGLAIFRLRRTMPNVERPYRVYGYPLVPAFFTLAMIGLVVNTLRERPFQSAMGVGLVLLGLPAYLWMRRSHRLTRSGS